jgi:outer membrane protein OmpA-like peptidoglycan-associated protein
VETIVKDTLKLSSLALAVTLLSASSTFALERASVQMAQGSPDDRRGGGGPAENGEAPSEKGPPPKEKAGPDARGGGEGRKPKGDDDGGGGRGERPERPQREKSENGDRSDRPARQQREPDGDSPPAKKAPAPAANDDDGPTQKKAPPPKADVDEPPLKKTSPPVERKSAPPIEKDEPAPKAGPNPEPREEPKKAPVTPKGAEPGEVPDGKIKKGAEPGPSRKDDDLPPAAKQPRAEPRAPVPGEKGPAAGAPPKGPDGSPQQNGFPSVRDGKAPETAPGAADLPAAPSEVKDLKELKQERKERSEDGGKRVIIEEPDKRTIVREGNNTIIRHDETERFRRLDRGNTRREKRNGLDISVSVRPGGIEIFSETDERGRSLRRYRRDRSGREVILFDNRDYYRRHNDGSYLDAIVDLPPPRMSISRQTYIVDYEEASDDEVYEALSAPPVEELDRTYSMEEVRRSPMLRDRMRRIDLDAINFEFGAWEVTQDQYPALRRVANAMKRVIDRNPEEVFLIEGHTDAVGSDEDNLSLSDRRAESVSIILTEQFAVPPENMATQGYGEQYLKVDTEEAERQNRRVAVRRVTPLLSKSGN